MPMLAGVVGSIVGGILLDSLGNTLRLANTLCGLSVLSGLVFLIPSFTLTKTFPAFMATFAAGQLLMFGLQVRVGEPDACYQHARMCLTCTEMHHQRTYA